MHQVDIFHKTFLKIRLFNQHYQKLKFQLIYFQISRVKFLLIESLLIQNLVLFYHHLFHLNRQMRRIDYLNDLKQYRPFIILLLVIFLALNL